MKRSKQSVSLFVSSLLLLVLVVISFWQTSLDFGDFRPSGSAETVVLWALSMLVVLGVFALGFIVFRSILKLYIERRQGRLGSKIKTKLVAGALALSIMPVVCLVIFSFSMLNRTIDKWFSEPTLQMVESSETAVNEVMRQKTETDAQWIASMAGTSAAFRTGEADPGFRERLAEIADGRRADYVALLPAGGGNPLVEFSSRRLFQGPVAWRVSPELVPQSDDAESVLASDFVYAFAPVRDGNRTLGLVAVAWKLPQEILSRRAEIEMHRGVFDTLHRDKRFFRYWYSGMLALISIFVLFVAVWLALFLSKQIIVPIEALVEATSEVSSGHLEHRVQVPATDELGGLVAAFNRMTQQLESKTRQLEQSNAELAQSNVELESRRRFINATLEGITPGVISVSAEGEILKVNSSLERILSPENVRSAKRLSELFSPDDAAEIAYMMNRARRTGLATREFELKRGGQILHIAVTVSSLEREGELGSLTPPGFVIVLEDTTDLLRAQKSAAWSEVARRVAHEIKNPLTPIALSADRMDRLFERYQASDDPAERQRLRVRFEQCTATITREVENLRSLVDEFAQFARFPAAHPERANLNEVVGTALDVFDGRLDDVTIRTHLSPDLPDVLVDPEHFKRAVVNLIDNAAEAVRGCWTKEIIVSTAPGSVPDTVELVVADSGPGISAEDKERLFLPYFSTKKRGTGLGLAIVSRVLAEHHATIRVEDNRPVGTRFIVDLPTADSAVAVQLGVSA